MTTKSDFARKYAAMLKEAATTSKTASVQSSFASVVKIIGKEFEGLESNNKTISEQDKQDIADEIAESLDYEDPKALRRILKAGAVDSLVTVTNQLDDLFDKIKK